MSSYKCWHLVSVEKEQEHTPYLSTANAGVALQALTLFVPAATSETEISSNEADSRDWFKSVLGNWGWQVKHRVSCNILNFSQLEQARSM